MKAWRFLAFAVIALSTPAFAAPDDAPPKVELPLGPYVRPGRPLDVRVIGGADRVRAPGTPWALPQGDRGDEFILQLTEATAGVLSLEIERGGRVERTSMNVEVLPDGATIVGVRGDVATPRGTRALRLPAAGLPTVREGWLLLDDVEEHYTAEARELLARIRDDPSRRAFAEPTLMTPDPAVFGACARVAADGPSLPGDAAALLGLLAGAEIALIAILRFRDVAPWRRAAWLIVPALAASMYLVVPGRLPGALAATAVAVDGGGRVVFVRVEARRDGHARFALGPWATTAAMVRFSADDATVTDAETGREVVLDLRAGESRVFAYAMHKYEGGIDRPPETSVPNALRAWLEGRGLRASADDYRFSSDSVPRAEGTVVVPVAAVIASTPAK